MDSSLDNFKGFADSNADIFDDFLERQSLKGKTNSSSNGSDSTETYTNTNTGFDSNLYSGNREQFAATIIESLNTSLQGNNGQTSNSLTSYSNSSLAQQNSGQDSFNMQTVTQMGCGCSACSGGAPANIIEDNGSLNTNSDVVVDSGGGGGGSDSGKPTATPAQFADYLENGYWADVGFVSHSWAEDTVTYSISNEFSAAQKAGFRMAFDQWQDVADLTFTEVGSGGMIDIIEGDDGRAYSSSGVLAGNITSNYISIDTAPSYWQDFNDIGDYAMITAIHEIGHSLGLGHSGNYNGTANYNDDAIWANDTRQYSVMSYFDADENGAWHSNGGPWQYASTPLLYDILAIQNIYGANNSIRVGNTTYGFNSNAGRDQFDFTITDAPVVAIWDAGGTDTLDLSGFSDTQTIRLGNGEFSNVGGMTGNLVIAFDTVIENAVGGSGIDNIYGNDADNVILGGNGNDVIFGSAGDDTLDGQGGTGDTANYNFSVTAFAFDFIDSVTVAFEHIADAWTDTISNIENFIFTDGTYTFEELEDTFFTNDFAPTVDATDLTLDSGATAMASDQITADDADGNALTYEVWDGTKPINTGYFELNGQRLKAQQGHILTQTEFDTLQIVGGNENGDDNLWVRVSDGIHTTAWEKFVLTTNTGSGQGFINTPPDVTVNDLDLDQGETVLASTVASASDVDGQDLTYEIWDGGQANNSGYFELNGQELSANTGHTLTQAEFDVLNIVGGNAAGDENLWVRVSDGEDTTAWAKFVLTTNEAVGGGGGNNAPTVTANDLNLDAHAFVLASSVITPNDADGDILTYEVWDGEKNSNSGYFDLNGTKLAANKGHTLTQAEFDVLRIVGGTFDGTDTLWIRVSDGMETTNWENFVLTTDVGGGSGGANSAPTVTTGDASLDEGDTVLASTIFDVNDVDGDTLTYEVWDSGSAGYSAYFDKNGQRLSAGTAHSLTQAEFDSLLIVGGSAPGTDKLWVRVSDGWETTGWVSMTLTTTQPSSAPAPQMMDYSDLIEENDGMAEALEDISGSETDNSTGQSEAFGGDVFSGINGFEETQDTGVLI